MAAFESDRTHAPSRNVRMSPRQTLQIDYAGRKWNGAYRVDGRVVHIESAYGSRAADMGRRTDSAGVAQRAFLEVVKEWRPAGPRS